MNTKVACIILAAGKSSRFGSPKQLVSINNTPLVLRTWHEYNNANLAHIALVIGAYAQSIQSLLPEQAEVVLAEHWYRGMSASIKAGILSLSKQENYTHLMIGLADQVAITTSHINHLLSTCKNNPTKIIAARFNNRYGSPAVFPLTYLYELAKLSGDFGAKALLKQHREHVIDIDMPDAGIDIDTVQDLSDWLNH